MAEHPLSDPSRDPPRYLAVVRHGHVEVFQFLRHFQESNLTEVVWDRRAGERRIGEQDVMADRRAGQRRSLASATWDALGFVLAPQGECDLDDPRGQRDSSRSYNLCVVRRGHTDVFLTLQEHFREDPGVHVIWDRRAAERRARRQPDIPERRQRERRRAERRPP